MIVDPSYERTADGDVLVWASAPSPMGVQADPAHVVLNIGGVDVPAREALTPLEAGKAPSLALGIVFIRAKASSEEEEPGKRESDRVYDGVKKALAGNEDTTVYFTPYGSSRPTGALRGQGSDIDDAEIANSWLYTEPPPPNLVDAARSNLETLVKAQERIKLLVIVTPGRDVTRAGDPKIAELAKQAHDGRVAVVVVSFGPEAAAPDTKAFLDDLVSQTGARSIDGSTNVSWTLEGLASARHGLLEFRRLRFPTSGIRPLFGGTKALRIRTGGAPWASLEPPLSMGPHLGVLLPLALVLMVVIVAGWYVRARLPWYAFLDELHAAVRDKQLPRDALQRLATRPAQLERFKKLSLDSLRRLDTYKYVQFRLPTGMEQVRALQTLARGGGPTSSAPSGGVAPAGASPARAFARPAAPPARPARPSVGAPAEDPDQLARFVAEHLGRPTVSAPALAAGLDYALADEATRLAGWTDSELDSWLADQAASFPPLATPAARSLVAEVRSLVVEYRRAETIAWIVATSSAGAAGQVFRLKPDMSALGWGAACDVRLPRVAAIAERHAEISCDGERCVIRRVDGEVAVRGQRVADAHEVEDGDVVRLGRADFIFKIARS